MEKARMRLWIASSLVWAVACGGSSINLDDPEYGGKPNAALRTSRITFLDDAIPSQGYTYAYPDGTSKIEVVAGAYTDKPALSIQLDPDSHAGAGVGFAVAQGQVAERDTATLNFAIKASGNVINELEIALVDDDKQDGQKVESRVILRNYVSLSETWQQVSIPLSDFADTGVYWDGENLVGNQPFAWAELREFKVVTQPGAAVTLPVQLMFAQIQIRK